MDICLFLYYVIRWNGVVKVFIVIIDLVIVEIIV